MDSFERDQAERDDLENFIREHGKPQDMSNFSFLRFAKRVIKPKVDKKPIGLVIDFPYDLRRSLEMKTFDASQKAKWTAFVNNAGTLAHVVCPEADILVRINYSYPIKHLSN